MSNKQTQIKNIKKAYCLAKQDFVVSGIDVVKEVFRQVDSKVKVKNLVIDGSLVKKGKKLITFKGPIQSLLRGERVSLNILQKMSGVATLTNRKCRRCLQARQRIQNQ